MMQSAPIRRAAATVLSRCWATSVSTVGTPVMSMIAIAESVSTIFSSRLSITTCVRALSSVPISGSATTPSHSFTTGVESSSSSSCWRWMTSSRVRWYVSAVNRPSASISWVATHIASAASAVRARAPRSNSGCLSEKTKVAVSVGVKPRVARVREISISRSFTGPHCGPLMSASAEPAPTAAAKLGQESVALDAKLVRAEQIGPHTWLIQLRLRPMPPAARRGARAASSR